MEEYSIEAIHLTWNSLEKKKKKKDLPRTRNDRTEKNVLEHLSWKTPQTSLIISSAVIDYSISTKPQAQHF